MAILAFIAFGLLSKFLWDITRLLLNDTFEANFQYATRIHTAHRQEEIQFQYRMSSTPVGAARRLLPPAVHLVNEE